MGSGPSSRRGQLQTKWPRRRPDQNPLSPDGQGLPKSREGTIPEPGCFSRFISPKNWGQALINDELTTCLLDNGAQLNFITPAYAVERGMDIMSLDRLTQEIGGPLPLIASVGGRLVEPTRFVLMNVKIPCVQGYNEDQVAWSWTIQG